MADLSSDGRVQLKPPCTVVVQSGASIVVSVAADVCGGGEVEVFERNGVVCVVGLEGADVVVAEAAERSAVIVGVLDRLDMSEGYDPGGLHRVAFHEVPHSDDLLIEHEFGLARLDIANRRLSWQQVHGDVTVRITGSVDDTVWLEGEHIRFGHRLSDGMFVLQPDPSDGRPQNR